MSRNLTLKDVAKKANVSVATISRVLNNRDGYSDETRERIKQIIDDCGYRRNAVARNLKMKKSNTIAVLIPQVETTYYINILNGIESMAQKAGYCVLVCHVGIDGNRTKEYIQMLDDRQVDGIIGCSLPPKEEIDKLMVHSGIPSILVSTLSFDYTIPYVKIDDYQAEYAATEYLIKKGHRKIAYLAGALNDVIAGVPRLNGYRQALLDAGIEYDDRLVACTLFSYETGIIAMNQLIENGGDFSAIVACCDEAAVAALSVQYKRGLKAPDDFSIIGFDNTRFAEMAIPPLTTIAQPLYDMGASAFTMLVEALHTGRCPASRIVPFSIVERDSVREIRS